MSTNPYSHFSGVPMDSAAIDDLLVSKGYGILSLCRDGEPYSIPISFGYDGESVYFGLLEDRPEPTKLAYTRDGATARLLVTDIRGRFDWQSVAVTGPVRALDPDDESEWQYFLETLVDNGWFMQSFEQSDAISGLRGWELEVEEVRGLEQKEEVYE
jgi:nitroimidazol reductase NimA-like FMN-containing flavoprotein (pyridoxamine 5'-phosphate oxidase superfamily)